MMMILALLVVVFASLSSGRTVWNVIEEHKELTDLAAAIKAAGFVSVLDNPDKQFTVFAPDNTGIKGPVSSATLLLHVIPAIVPSSKLSNALFVNDTLSPDSFLYVFLKPSVQFCSKSCAGLVRADLYASNGVVHIIDAVIEPAAKLTIAGVVQGNPDFSILLSALTLTNLAGVLASPAGAYTVFAPTNKAFTSSLTPTQLTCLTDGKHLDELKQILLYHVVSGIVPSFELSSGEVPTLEGGKIKVHVSSSGVVLNSKINVVAANVLTINGVAHVIDGVLVPSGSFACLQ